jgi:hypothetical protein
MYAVLRLNSYDPEKFERSRQSVEEFDKLHAAQPGYVGSVSVDLGGGRRFAVNLWQSSDHSREAMKVLVPEVDRLLGPLMSEPSQFVGAGEVISFDLPASPEP